MCKMVGLEDNGFGVVVLEGEYCDVILQRARPTPGYCVAIWKRGHQSELADLDDLELAGYWRENAKVARALQQVYEPAKVNYQVLGNGVPHIHTHIILRYLDDPAPGAPLPMNQAAYEKLSEDAFRAEVAAVKGALAPA
jgi:diadenosine tetraphosphate (Ap4A) HIT family hydrolase